MTSNRLFKKEKATNIKRYSSSFNQRIASKNNDTPFITYQITIHFNTTVFTLFFWPCFRAFGISGSQPETECKSWQ